MKESTRQLQTDQLYPEESFVYYCTADEGSVSKKIPDHISPQFLEACDKEGFIKPLHSQEQEQMTPQGKVTRLVKFYSPFQIFMVSVLSKNIVDEEGLLRGDIGFDIQWQKEQKTRYMAWGDMSGFNVDIEKNGSVPPPGGVNHFSFAEDFYNFLKLLHSLDIADPYEDYNPGSMRLYRSMPSFQYDLSPLKNESDILSSYSLDAGKLKSLLREIGLYASHIDPLAQWYYYIKKHSQRRRDELKGMASVAQDLYGICDILIEMIEIETGEKMPPLLDFLHSDIQPMGMKKVEYAGGTDLQVIKDVVSEFQSWIDEPSHKEMLDRIKDSAHDGVSLEQILERIKNLQLRIDDFESRYGDRRYGEGLRYISPEKDMPLSKLDPLAQRHVEMMMKHYRERGLEIEGKQELATDNPEVLDLWAKGKKSEALKKYLTIQEQYEIVSSIEHVLDDIQREFMNICSWISHSFYPIKYKLEHEKKMAEPRAFQAFLAKQDPNDPKLPTLRAQFWHTGLKDAMKEYDDELEKIKDIERTMYGFINKVRLAYCSHCRKNYVAMHQQHQDSSISKGAVCDECMTNTPDLQSIKDGEWRCRFYDEQEGGVCGGLLYKFAHNNVLNTWVQRTTTAKITLNYGQMEVRVRCPRCHTESVVNIDWGWLP